MEIEILTTKKKLSASIIKQMPFICPKDFKEVKIIGGLRNIRWKDGYVILCQFIKTKQYFLLNTGYYIVDATTKESPITVRFNSNSVISFENKENRNNWFNEYKTIIESTTQLFI